MKTEIFSYLDQSSLKTSARVCTNWRSTVLGSSRLMRKTKLRVHNFKQQKKFIKNAGKSFQTVCIKNKENKRKKCTRSELLTILRGIANVRNLELSGDFLGFDERKVSNLELKHLNELTLNDSANSSRISKILKNAKLQKLTLNCSGNLQKLDKHFESWLMGQYRLDELHIKNHAIKIFCKEFSSNKLKIQLRKLTLELELEVTRFHEVRLRNTSLINFQRNFISFCQSQRSLEEVVLSVSFSSNVWAGLIAHLLESKKLKKLTLCGNGLPVIESRSNETLEDLCIKHCWHRSNATSTWQTLAKLRMLKNLEINYHGQQVQDIITSCSRLSQLKTLKLAKLYHFLPIDDEPDAFQEINLPNLTTIYLKYIYVTQLGWTSITSRCLLVESLILDRFILGQGSASLICEQWKNLKVLDLGYGIYLDELFPALLTCLSLKELKIVEKMKQQLEHHLGEAVAPFEIIVKDNVLAGFDMYYLQTYFEFWPDRSLYLDNFPDIN